jgi:hypothetical protein
VSGGERLPDIDDDVLWRQRRPQAMSASDDPRCEHFGGRDCPRCERRWPRLPEARAVAATVTSRGAICGGGHDLLRRER